MCQMFAGQNPERYQLETRRMRLNGQSTSIRLEHSFWAILDEIAESEGLSTPGFVSKLHGRGAGTARGIKEFHRAVALYLPCVSRDAAGGGGEPDRRGMSAVAV